MRFQNFLIFPFQVTNYFMIYSLICSRNISYFHFFIVCILIPYAFYFLRLDYGQISNKSHILMFGVY